MAGGREELQVYSVGPVTVLGFGGREILDQIDIGSCRLKIVNLVKTHQVQTLAFDLTGVKLMPSGMLGLLASLRELGVVVELYNPSEDIQEVLQVTRLNELLTIRQLEE